MNKHKELMQIFLSEGMPGIENHFKKQASQRDKSWAIICGIIIVMWIGHYLSLK